MPRLNQSAYSMSANFNYPMGKPHHWIRFNKSLWNTRSSSNFNEKYIKRLNEVIEKSYEITMKQIAGGAVEVNNEASFQLQFAYVLKTIGELYKFSTDDLFTIELENTFKFKSQLPKSNGKRARIDIVLSLGSFNHFATAAIELKFFKKENHREPNNRYDVFQDLQNLEVYEQEGLFDHCFLILATDHEHYIKQAEYQPSTSDFDFRHNVTYKSGKILTYSTAKPYGKPITLNKNYLFSWDIGEKHYSIASKQLYFLKIKL